VRLKEVVARDASGNFSAFQFLLVRLKVDDARFQGLQNVISIPSGAIKSGITESDLQSAN